ncbi:hypothetical protein COW99_00485 [Candidatus Roizmanbacteria bacterium CG22_combo_CG10-13_8_21_14_all_38_20]|uniref:Methyltransferase type 11 domain-containing protein n=1 Tax=Candidatus Roizmanbacteria bacterium CG22_combo_CG10-13_8_21_14_all_38_20 TaxID=1974862 RepID=A0A2H0BYX5_9BACT|nr:class I SAM-dependent methyltransferase [Candidatus Microgenomates bacterium]PIP62148.1 MAG: hypothetical protein COW99_00485 [Candidatus Roizmanbacteria bacterium CG22_combo_CG10-13_8_21_14_all_38_20]PJC30914.1 MAG: hypothetical protein CO050_05100 [Candidatus Roizmanbacteria bacterium CG_4_9_14_0_2_um_filter_38_17]
MNNLVTNPSLIVKYLFMRFYFQIENFVAQVAKQYDKPDTILLDIGSGHSPYHKYFKKTRYLTNDIKQNENKTIDIIGNIEKGLPKVKSSSLDYVICTQVIEHLTDPQLAFKEFNRMLKPNGKLFLTTNFLYQIHMAPYDYYRFTSFGLEHLGKSVGFKIDHLRSHGGIFQVLSYIITTLPVRLYLKNHYRLTLIYLVAFSPIILVLNLTATILDGLDRDRELTINYEVIYTKP